MSDDNNLTELNCGAVIWYRVYIAKADDFIRLTPSD
jgi:hypothetical protein